MVMGCCGRTIIVSDLRHRRRVVVDTQIFNNAHVLVQNNMAANVLILPGMTRQGVY